MILGINSLFQNLSYAKSYQKEALKKQEIIILIHGLLRSSRSMIPIKNFLERQGYATLLYAYPSAKYDIQSHGFFLRKFIKNLLIKNPQLKIHFITHSLGGIITREALAKLSANQLKNIGYLIMLAPPNQGSFLAKLCTQLFPLITFPIRPLAELSSDKSSYIHRVPIPKVKIGIIAGRFDAKVPPSSAYLRSQRELVVINTNHTFITYNSEAKNLILHFLKSGDFKD